MEKTILITGGTGLIGNGIQKYITALFFKTGHSNYKLFSVYNFLL